jgi:hypothetical protein
METRYQTRYQAKRLFGPFKWADRTMNNRFRCSGLLVDWRSTLLFLPLVPSRAQGQESRGWLLALDLLCLVSLAVGIVCLMIAIWVWRW